jgi:cytochrome c-type biogenesis protein CcmH/NrfF
MSNWYLFIIPVVIVVVWVGWYIGAFMKDRQRSRDTTNDAERLDVHPQGPTSTPREQQDRDD